MHTAKNGEQRKYEDHRLKWYEKNDNINKCFICPKMWCNLFSAMGSMNQGFDVIGKSKDKNITVSNKFKA